MNTDEQDKKSEYLKLMAEIAYLSIAVNEFTDFCVFFEFSGHVQHVRIEIAESKTAYQNKLASTEFYSAYQSKHTWKMVENGHLLAKRDHLKSILDDHEIPYAEMDRVQEIITTYEF